MVRKIDDDDIVVPYSTVLTVVFPPEGEWKWYDVAKVGWVVCRLILLTPKEYLCIPCRKPQDHPLREYFNKVAKNMVRHYLPEDPVADVIGSEIVVGELNNLRRWKKGCQDGCDASREKRCKHTKCPPYLSNLPILVGSYAIADVWGIMSVSPPDIPEKVSCSFAESESYPKRLTVCRTDNWMAWGVEVGVSNHHSDVVIGRTHRVFRLSLPLVVIEKGGLRIQRGTVCGRNVIVVVRERFDLSDDVYSVLSSVVELAETEVGKKLLEENSGIFYLDDFSSVSTVPR